MLKTAIAFYYPNSSSFIDVDESLYKDTLTDYIIDIGEKYLNSNLSSNNREILEYELQLNKLYFNKNFVPHSNIHYVMFVYLSNNSSNTIFNKDGEVYIINYLNKRGEIISVEISREYNYIINQYLNSNFQLHKDIIYNLLEEVGAQKIIDGHHVKNIFFNKNHNEHAVILQWHITNQCENKCSHCYLQEESNIIGGIKDELSFNEMKLIVNELFTYALKNKSTAHITLSGGDPLLSDNVFNLLEYANMTFGYPLITSILGNPDLINESIAKNLQLLGIRHVQFSIDGLEKTNDLIRSKNNWNKVWRAIDILNDIGIKNNIMFTVSRMNYRELIPLIQYCADIDKTNLSFARYCKTNSKDQLEILTPNEYRHFLLRVFETFRYYYQEKHIDRWDLSKESLYALLYNQIGIDIYQDKGGCCLLGNGKSIAMLPNGTILYCRRAPYKIGNWPYISIQQALEKHSKIHDYNNIPTCMDCNVKNSCRGGCAAVNYRQDHTFNNRDVQCWR